MIKILIITILTLGLIGCANLTSTTSRTTTINPTNGTPIVSETTTLHAYALLDANSSLTKVANRSGYATNSAGTFAPGSYATGVNESATSTNIANAIMVGVITGLKAAGMP